MRQYKSKIHILPVVFFFILSLSGCSQAAKDKWLRVFVDGVPDTKKDKTDPLINPESEKKTEDTVTKVKRPEKPVPFLHKPFSEQMCDSCHDSKFSQKLAMTGKDLCFLCHDDFTANKKMVHYPVGEGLCTECHDPHQSENKKLLKKTVPQICYTCHDDFTKGKKVVHYPVAEGLCLECHDQHSADNEHMLRKAVPEICFTCHDEAEIKAQPQHEGQSMCLECHEAHSSNEEKLLK